MKNALITLIVVALAGTGIYYFFNRLSADEEVENPPIIDTSIKDTSPVATGTPQTDDTVIDNTDVSIVNDSEKETIIGSSVEGNEITAYHFGTGEKELLFVGGIHGGYSWNTVAVAYKLLDYLETNPESIPENISITVIPVLNPDGLDIVMGTTGRFDIGDGAPDLTKTIPGRFNANNVDLNRNFDCDWQSEAVWQNKAVSGGTETFSEPESLAVKNYIETTNPSAVVVWYSAAGGVFSSSCHNGPSSETRTLTNLYANASGYKSYEDFDFYKITGDMVNWIAKNDIPAISVLLSSHDEIEWDKNKAGIEALIKYYAQ